jgi:hypothetical protein
MSPHVHIELEPILVFHDFSSDFLIFSSDFASFPDFLSDLLLIEGISGRNFSIFSRFFSKYCDFSSETCDFTDFLREFPTFRGGYPAFLVFSRDFSRAFLISFTISPISSANSPITLTPLREEIAIESILGDHLRENFGWNSSDDSIFRYLVRCTVPDQPEKFATVLPSWGRGRGNEFRSHRKVRNRSFRFES